MKKRYHVNLLAGCIISIAYITGCLSTPSSGVHTPTAQEFPLVLNWSTAFENNIDRMALGDDIVVVALMDADHRLTLYAYDAHFGTEQWCATITGNTFDFNLKINNGKVFVAYSPNFYALSSEDGSLIWKVTDSIPADAEISAFSRGHILVIKPSMLVAYNIETGNTEWSVVLARGKEDVFFDDKTNLIYLLLGTKIRAINDENGNIDWEKDLTMPGAVTFENEVVYFVNDKQPGVTLNAFDISTQNTIWRTTLDALSEHLFIWNNNIIGVSRNRIISVNKKSGDENWDYWLPLGPYRPPICIGDIVLLRNADTNQVIALGLEHGNILGKLNLPARKSVFIVARNDDLLSIDSLDPVLALYDKNQLFIYREK